MIQLVRSDNSQNDFDHEKIKNLLNVPMTLNF